MRKFGGRFLGALLSFGYGGKLYSVNPQEREVLRLETYRNVGNIPWPVDFASIAIPARTVSGVVEEYLSRGIKAVQILSADFGEVGEEGQKFEREVARTAAKALSNFFSCYQCRDVLSS